jgi:hypothetical protein
MLGVARLHRKSIPMPPMTLETWRKPEYNPFGLACGTKAARGGMVLFPVFKTDEECVHDKFYSASRSSQMCQRLSSYIKAKPLSLLLLAFNRHSLINSICLYVDI